MSNHVRRGACATTGKRCFDTRTDAKHSIRQSHLKLAVNKCRDCGYFHQGGWHGTKDRAAHRGEIPSETITVADAARALNVTTAFVARLVESGKIRSENGLPNRGDIDRLTQLTEQGGNP
jgi:hypothetical protein